MNNVKSKVALVRCFSYQQEEVEQALAKGLAFLGGFSNIFSAKLPAAESKLILKPNLLAKTDPDKACTTHPAVFHAVGKALQEAGYTNLKYGDSPGNPMIRVEKVAEECGIKQAADDLGIPMGDFEHGTQVGFAGRAADHFVLCNEVLAADGIINVCKMKTHQLERITGAMKNTFGCVFGINKGASHARFATAETFAKMIADLNLLVHPILHVMDGVVAMEGNGPSVGNTDAHERFDVIYRPGSAGCYVLPPGKPGSPTCPDQCQRHGTGSRHICRNRSVNRRRAHDPGGGRKKIRK